MKILITAFLTFTITGCVSTPVEYVDPKESVKTAIKEQRYEAAYRLSEPLIDKRRVDREENIALIKSNPNVMSAAKNTFTEASLRQTLEEWSGDKMRVARLELSRIEKYENVADESDVHFAKAEFEKVFPGYISDRSIYDPVDEIEYGRIIDVQVINQSTAGSNAGSGIGTIIGSAAYVDNSFSGNSSSYSAMGHVAAAFLGGMLGSAYNEDASISYEINYFVKSNNGEVIKIVEASSLQVHEPSGTCVEITNKRHLDVTNDSKCD